MSQEVFLLRTVFMGTPEFAVTPLRHLVVNSYEVAAVYTRPDRPAGRGRGLAASPVKRAALELGLPVVQPASLKPAEVVEALAALKPEVIVVAAYGRILPQAVLDLPPHGCVNIHPSLLPRFRGASPVPAAILAGDEFTGVSIMLMDAGLDTGPVLNRGCIPISPRDNAGSLMVKLSQVAAGLLQEALVGWSRRELTPRPQDEAQATCCGEITKEQGEIDWHLSALELSRRVRAFTPWPGCYTRWRGRRLIVQEAVALPGDGQSGRVVALDREEAALGVYAGSGVLGLVTVQPEGGRAMPAAEFLRGHKELIGAALPG
ncbi:MAG: methionyl-tRNA formyltransferase [Chloroflexi bacterium]|nr:methionyl-tRNA formyltransferase [Chloroflexota bacterium]